jgi:carbonic anhydrase
MSAPINIQANRVSGECYLKCLYEIDYPSTPSVVVSNLNNDYLLIKPSGLSSNVVNYNDAMMSVKEIRLYQPSLHTYDGVHADAEIVITHQGSGKKLAVCIPISQIGKSQPGINKNLEALIGAVSEQANKAGMSTTNLSMKNFSLNNLIPISPFYSYTASLPYSPFTAPYELIVFPIGASLSISSNSQIILSKVLEPSNIPIKPNQYLYINEKGPIRPGNGEDQIYIDCQPVGSEGEVLVEEPRNANRPLTSTAHSSLNEDIVPVVVAVGAIGLIVGCLAYALRKK